MSLLVYQGLYHLTFVLHALFATFVFGATSLLVVLGIVGLWRGPASDRPWGIVAATLRDRLPFALGLAITFGIGPLLFVQLLDGRGFYTAAILLSHRFMAILPALIVGFYLLYVQKTSWRIVESRLGRLLIPGVAFLCFGYTAWSWSEVHLLAQTPGRWQDVYVDGPASVTHALVLPRLLVFAGLACHTTGWLGGLALCEKGAVRTRLASVALLGSAMIVAGMVWHGPGIGLRPPTWSLVLAFVTVAVGLVAWSSQLRAPPRGPGWMLGLVVLSELERIAAVRMRMKAALGADLDDTTAQGFIAFLVTFLFVAVAIAGAVRMVRRNLRVAKPR